MALFKKLGSFASRAADSIFGTGKPAKKTGTTTKPIQGTRANDPGFLTTEDIKREVDAAVAKTQRQIEEDQKRIFGDNKARQTSESLYDTYRDELAREAREDWERRKRLIESQQENLDPLSRFLYGELVHVVSTNVDWIQFDRNRELLYIGFKNGAAYVYYQIDAGEASSMFTASSHGKWVWDNLRVRGTVWGYKRDFAFLEYTLGGYQPRYMDESGWQMEHAAIPPSGEPPASWKVPGAGPYADLPWYANSPGPESDKHQLPMARIFEEPDSPFDKRA